MCGNRRYIGVRCKMKNVIVVFVIFVIIGTAGAMIIKELGDYVDEVKGSD